MRRPFERLRGGGAFAGGPEGRGVVDLGCCALVASRSSKPLIAPSSSAQSSALRAMGPAWSRLEAKAIMP